MDTGHDTTTTTDEDTDKTTDATTDQVTDTGDATDTSTTDTDATDPGDSEVGDSEAVGEDPAPPPRRARGWLVAVVSLVVLLVVSLVVGVVLLRPVLDHRGVTERRDAILSAARDVAQRSYSLDFETFPQESAKIIGSTTGNYRQGLIDTVPGLQHILTQGKVKSTCTITAAGIERDDENTATVLLSISSSVTNTEIQIPQVRIYRVAMNLERQGSQWLVQSNDVIA